MSVSTITPWVIGNWKMNPVQAEALSLVRGIKNLLETAPIAEDQCHLGVAPIAIALSQIQAELSSAVRPIYTVAQDVSRISGTGPYTGEVSAELLADSQIHYVLVGHSERREIFAENADILNAKIKNALSAGLTVIYCVGESLEQREAGQAEAVVLQQICDIAAVVEAEQWKNIVI
ncbi:MAG: triose-phosphate isomerase, partial [Acinetobacter sp.]